MGGPGWLTGIFAAIMVAVAVYCAGRLIVARRIRRPTEVDSDGVHVVMGVAMAGMLDPGLRILPAGIWEPVFAVGAGWFGWQFVQARRSASAGPNASARRSAGLSASASAGPGAWRCPHPLPHLVECVAMIYVFAAVAPRVAPAGMGMSGSGARFSVVALALAVFMMGYVVWVGDGLTALAPAALAPVTAGTGTVAAAGAGTGGHLCRPYLAPRCAAVCKIAMGVTMGFMLILML
jgi:Domain of unknown function (DUF5134)